MKKKKLTRREVELNRLYDKLNTLEPGTDEYKKVMEEILKVEHATNEAEQTRSNKVDLVVKIGGIVVPIGLTVLKYALNRKMVEHIGIVEQMETFTSTAGRKIIPDMFERM